MSEIAAPLDEFRATVLPEWIDFNGHMNAGYYMVAFDDAITPWTRFVGLDTEHRDEHGVTTFSVEGHITYDRELLEGAPIRITTQLLGYDSKRIHAVSLMYHGDEGYLAASNEVMSLHVSMESRRVAPMDGSVLERLEEVWEAHRHLEVPAQVGRVMSVPGWSR